MSEAVKKVVCSSSDRMVEDARVDRGLRNFEAEVDMARKVFLFLEFSGNELWFNTKTAKV
jgi:hypothetical protein